MNYFTLSKFILILNNYFKILSLCDYTVTKKCSPSWTNWLSITSHWENLRKNILSMLVLMIEPRTILYMNLSWDYHLIEGWTIIMHKLKGQRNIRGCFVYKYAWKTPTFVNSFGGRNIRLTCCFTTNTFIIHLSTGLQNTWWTIGIVANHQSGGYRKHSSP